ncbi:sugar ABC transporter permease [Mycoplasmopsis ciconiae]|uniref:Sugar ABC transporter permease n=1 Tax=Mycoplasmopsis ciconiae TaxID=561067 RepID=A0ABU7ML29_9BACT|nr:sugar ABC transporter permease [Mycoplasmopsis ciconiae]
MYKKRYFFTLILPTLIIFTIVIVIPTVIGITYSFTDWKNKALEGFPNFVGFENYKKAFETTYTNPQSLTYTIGYTFLFSIISLITVNVLGFFLAYVLNQKFLKGKSVFRGLFFIPNLISGIVLGYIWQRIFDQAIPQLFPKFLDGESIRTSGSLGALFAMVIVYTWQMAGYVMVIYIAALQNVNQTLVEAAKIEGASKSKVFRSVVIPSVMPAITIAVFLVFSGSFKMFDLNFAITAEKVGTFLLSYDIYLTGSTNNLYAVAQAKSVIFIILVSSISILQVYITKKWEVQS